MACEIDNYRGWVKHARICDQCHEKLKAYNREAKRRSRAGATEPVGYSPELRDKVVRDAEKVGARKAAERNEVGIRLVYKWCEAAGTQPAPRTSRVKKKNA